MGMVFDFSEMEELPSEGQPINGDHLRKDNEVDLALLNSTAFSIMSIFSHFINPNGTECMATDRQTQWHSASQK